MDCKKVIRLLPDYTEGVLPPKVEKHIEEHLAECLACQKEHSFYIDEDSLLHSPILPAAYEHVSVSGKVMERIMQENKWASPKPEHTREMPSSLRRMITGFAFAVFIACLLPLFMLGQELNEVMHPVQTDQATDTVVSAEALPLPAGAGQEHTEASYGVVATFANPLPYTPSQKEQSPQVDYGLLAALFGILVTVVSMSWLSRSKKQVS
jgi:anti-sigma factor RsiW